MRNSSSSGQEGNQALRLIVLLGIVSLLGDVAYEGGRSIAGPFLAFLGAGAGLVGFLGGAGEFIGFALRLGSGYLADRSGRYWLFAILGYSLVLAVPLLAFAGRWETAALLLILERVGKALRAPSRDTILAHASHRIGRGRGFGLHEALDQVGALLGPLLVSLIISWRGGYRPAFAALFVPAVLLIPVLLWARRRVPAPEHFEDAPPASRDTARGLPRLYWLYTMFIFVSVAGFANFQIISYHCAIKKIVPVTMVPLLYALAMGSDGGVALFVGRIYDRLGFVALAAIPGFTLILPFFCFSENAAAVTTGMVLWGAVLGVHETIMRAAIADIIPPGRRALAYGIFNAAYGLAWMVGGAAMGWLYPYSSSALKAFACACQLVSLPLFVLLLRRERAGHPGR